jgi:hypothetical protein
MAWREMEGRDHWRGLNPESIQARRKHGEIIRKNRKIRV